MDMTSPTVSRPASRLRERFRRTTRDAILQAAEALFSERHLGDTRMEDIAERAGVAVGTLYNYFHNRHALLDAVVATVTGDCMARLERMMLADSVPFPERLERFLLLVVEDLEVHFRLYAVLVEAALVSARSTRAPSASGNSVLAKLFAATERLLQTAIERGELRPDNGRLYPEILVGMLRGVFMRKILTADPEPLGAYVTQMARFFLERAERHGC
jgi:AcrR family transcriptional regulator